MKLLAWISDWAVFLLAMLFLFCVLLCLFTMVWLRKIVMNRNEVVRLLVVVIAAQVEAALVGALYIQWKGYTGTTVSKEPTPVQAPPRSAKADPVGGIWQEEKTDIDGYSVRRINDTTFPDVVCWVVTNRGGFTNPAISCVRVK